MIYAEPFNRIAEDLRREIEESLGALGILCRVFGRGKTSHSLENKLSKKPGKYSFGARLVQDAVGIRVVIYFPEDIESVKNALCKKYKFDQKSSTIDIPSTTNFSVSRYNLIFKIPSLSEKEMNRAIKQSAIDSTFEVQIRTIFSEGWHEVEHDLRYKCPAHWDGCDDLSRALNGVVATLETAEWSTRKIFDDLAYKHYRNKQWTAMLHTSLRMRLTPSLSDEVSKILDEDGAVAKDLFRINKAQVIECLSKLEPRIPLNLDNIVYLWNFVSTSNPLLHNLTPNYLIEVFERDL